MVLLLVLVLLLHQNTATTYNSAADSAKLVATDTGEYSQNVATGSGTYTLSGYAYTNGSAVTSSNAQLYYNGSAITTTYTSVGGGWYQLSGTVTGTGGTVAAGIQVLSGNTVYLDGMSMVNYKNSGTLVSSIFNSGVEENWGTLTYSDTRSAIPQFPFMLDLGTNLICLTPLPGTVAA